VDKIRLVDAQVGLSGIPQRFPDGLESAAELIYLARALGESSKQVVWDRGTRDFASLAKTP
jgi:hypothetical protein